MCCTVRYWDTLVLPKNERMVVLAWGIQFLLLGQIEGEHGTSPTNLILLVISALVLV